MNKTIYVLHEYGAPSHYNALVELGRQKSFNVKFAIFQPKCILSNLYHKRFSLVFFSIYLLLSLPFRKNETIVLGIAPFNKLLKPLSYVLRNHKVFYHTSYTHWDGKIMARPTKSKELISFWNSYISNIVKHIFAVSEKTKSELINNNYAKEKDITVVNHSYEKAIDVQPHDNNKKFIYVGRLVECKGIQELLEVFAKREDAELTIAGSGELEKLVCDYASKYKNINYIGYINGFEQLYPIYLQHSFVILNSKRDKHWEELFGITLIEGMACGCVPIATDHPGPKEIISNGKNGFLVKEGHIEFGVNRCLTLSKEDFHSLQIHAIIEGESFHSSVMSGKWEAILNIK